MKISITIDEIGSISEASRYIKALEDAQGNRADDVARTRQALQDKRDAALGQTHAAEKPKPTLVKPADRKAPDQALADRGPPKAYEADVKPFALALAKSNPSALLKIYGQFGVSVGTELTPEQWPDALQAIKAKLAEGVQA